MIEYTQEDFKRFAPNDALLSKLFAAEKEGNDELAAEIRKKIVYPAEALLAFRDNMGAEEIIAMGLNDSECVRKYGKDWLYNESL